MITLFLFSLLFRTSVTGDAADGHKGSRKYDILKESKQSDVESGMQTHVPQPMVADRTKEIGRMVILFFFFLYPAAFSLKAFTVLLLIFGFL